METGPKYILAVCVCIRVLHKQNLVSRSSSFSYFSGSSSHRPATVTTATGHDEYSGIRGQRWPRKRGTVSWIIIVVVVVAGA